MEHPQGTTVQEILVFLCLRKEEVDRNDRLHQEKEDRQLKARQSDRDSQTQREETLSAKALRDSGNLREK